MKTNKSSITYPYLQNETQDLAGSIPNQVDSFQEDLSGVNELDSFYLLRHRAKQELSSFQGSSILRFNNKASDCSIIDKINKKEECDTLITEFNAADIDSAIGSVFTKKLVISILNTIKSSEFRDTEEGELIYKAYRELLNNVNVHMLELHKDIIFDEENLLNTVLFLVLGCDFQINNWDQLSSNINQLISCTNVNIITTIIDNQTLDNIQGDLADELTQINEKALKDIADIEKSKQSLFSSISSGTYNFLKWSLASNKALAGFQLVLYTTGLGFAGKLAIPLLMNLGRMEFSKTKSLTNSPNIKLDSGKNPEPNPDLEEGTLTISKAFANFLIEVAKIIKNKD